MPTNVPSISSPPWRHPVSTVFSADILFKLAECAVVVVCALILVLAIKRIFRVFAERINLPRLAFNPLQAILRYSILIGAGLTVLRIFNFTTDTLVTVLATVFGLVAIGFVAVWSVLSNFLCTFVLILFKPFSVGDEIEFPSDNVGGKVVDLSLLFTTLHGPEGEDYHIPNNMFFQKIFKRRAGAVRIDLEAQLRETKPAQLHPKQAPR